MMYRIPCIDHYVENSAFRYYFSGVLLNILQCDCSISFLAFPILKNLGYHKGYLTYILLNVMLEELFIVISSHGLL